VSAECRHLNDGTGPTCSCSGKACALGFTGDELADSERAWAYERERTEAKLDPGPPTE
jgi:hypothetical protein